MSEEKEVKTPNQVAEQVTSTAKNVPDPLKFYELTRDYVKHEDGLVNYKLTYLLGAQTLLFAAYGIAIGSNQPSYKELVEKVLLWVPITGTAIGIFTFLSLVGSVISLWNLNARWKKLREKMEIKEHDYPQIYGRPWAFVLGWFVPLGITILFCVVWIIFLYSKRA